MLNFETPVKREVPGQEAEAENPLFMGFYYIIHIL